MSALPIFPGSLPPSIVGANELNFCVRYGNRWNLIAINTDFTIDKRSLHSPIKANDLDSGITYLPRQSPAKYCRRK